MKKIKIIFLVISLIWTIFNFVMAFYSPVSDFTKFLNIIPILIAIYYEIDIIYIFWNKILAYFFLKTIVFKATSHRHISNEVSILDIEQHITRCLVNKKYTFKQKWGFERTDDFLIMTVSDPSGIKTTIKMMLQQVNDHQLISFTIDNQVAYRSVRHQWDEFRSLSDDFFSNFAKVSNTNDRYDVAISTDKMKKYNPFYRLTVRHLGKTEIQKFDLKFKDKNLEVTTTMNKIYGTSSDIHDIERLIKEYIPLSQNYK